MQHFSNFSASQRLKMRRTTVVSTVLLLALAGRVTAADFEWKSATPESQGMSQAKLDDLKNGIARTTKALFVVRNDRVVYEWYAEGHSAEKTHGTASLAKAIVGGVSCALAMTDGKISLDDPAAKYIKE